MTCEGILMVLCGLPGSGKSHFAKCLQQKVNDGAIKLNDNTAELTSYVIEYDRLMPASKEKELIESLNDSESQNRSAWKSYRERIVKAVDRFVRYAKDGTSELENESDQLFEEIKARNPRKTSCKSVFVVDDNMYLMSMRQPYYQLAKKYIYGFCEVHVTCDWNSERNEEREFRVNKQTMEQMFKKFEPPQSSTNRFIFAIRNNDDHYESCWCDLQALINKCFENPVQIIDDSENQEVSRQICLKNVIHKSDRVLRILISETMNNEKGKLNREEIQVLGKKLNKERQHLLEKIRTGEIILPEIITNEIETGNFENILPAFKQFLKSHFSYM